MLLLLAKNRIDAFLQLGYPHQIYFDGVGGANVVARTYLVFLVSCAGKGIL